MVGNDGTWTLSDVTVTHWHEAGAASTAREEQLASLEWHSTLSPKVVAAAVLPVSTMSTLDLWRYIGHLVEQRAGGADCRRSSSGIARSIRSCAW